ncbi:hypothetical protein ACEE69_09530, partial [Streptococcus suis]
PIAKKHESEVHSSENKPSKLLFLTSSSGVKRSGRHFQPIAKKLESDWYILVKTILASYSCLLHSRK